MNHLKIVLVQAPAFCGPCPSTALALLSAHLKVAGFRPSVHDASLGARQSLSRQQDHARPTHFTYPEDFMAALKRSEKNFQAGMTAQAEAILSYQPDMVGFSVLQATEECSLALAQHIKRSSPKTIVVFGGPQCLRETMGLELIKHAAVDAVAVGEADQTIVELARRLEDIPGRVPCVKGLLIKDGGRILDCGDPRQVENLDDLPFLDFDVFDSRKYDPARFFLNTSRGCVRRCSFCTHILQQRIYRTMSPERVAAEIRHHLVRRPEKYFIEFSDSLINGDVRRLSALSALLAQVRMDRAVARRTWDFGWGGMAIIHPTMTPSLLKAMHRGGCQVLSYGMESASQRIVDGMHKKFRISDAERVIRDTKSAGIKVKVFLMVGFPGETDEDFYLTLRFLERHGGVIDKVAISYCHILKGSFLDARQDAFGIDLRFSPDRRLWLSKDGTNTHALRRQRYAALEKCALRNGIDVERQPHNAIFQFSKEGST